MESNGLNFGVSLPHRWLVGAAIVVGTLASACGPVHVDPSWASISTINNGSQIMIAFGDHLSLIDPADGRPVELLDSAGKVRVDDQGNPRIWEVKAADNQQTRFYTAPLELPGELLMVASYDKRILTIDAPVARLEAGGVPIEGHIVAAPAFDDERVYVGLSEKDLVAYDRDGDDLTEAWRITTEHGVWSTPLVVGDTVYFGTMEHDLYAVDSATGDVKWKTNLEGALTATPAYLDGRLYIGSFARKIFAVSAETGEKLAEYPTHDWVWSSPALVDGVLYASDMGGSVYALTITADGFDPLWENKVSERAIRPTPLVTDEFVIVGSRDHNVYWLNRASGVIADTKVMAGEVVSDLLLVEPSEQVQVPEPLVVVSTTANQELLVAFTLSRGQRLWVYGR